MWKFTTEDYIYYAAKGKPIAKRPRPAANPIKTENRTQTQPPPLKRPRNQPKRTLREASHLTNAPLPPPEPLQLKPHPQPHYSTSLAEMQRAVREQENMYRRVCRDGLRLSVLQGEQESALSDESLGLRADPTNYFSELLSDPRDKESTLFLEHATEPSLEKEERCEEVDYDVSAYFTV